MRKRLLFFVQKVLVKFFSKACEVEDTQPSLPSQTAKSSSAFPFCKLFLLRLMKFIIFTEKNSLV